PPASSPLFPYTTLFRSRGLGSVAASAQDAQWHRLDRPDSSASRARRFSQKDLQPEKVPNFFRVDRSSLAFPGRGNQANQDSAQQDRKSTRLNYSHEWIS